MDFSPHPLARRPHRNALTDKSGNLGVRVEKVMGREVLAIEREAPRALAERACPR